MLKQYVTINKYITVFSKPVGGAESVESGR